MQQWCGRLAAGFLGPPGFIIYYYHGNQDPHKSLQPIRSSNSRSRLPRDQRSTTESTEIARKRESESTSPFRVLPGGDSRP